jgi:hypothetical protein
MNLAKWLENIKNSNSFSIIILNRFYKMNINNIISLVEKYKTLDVIYDNINNAELILQNKSFYIEDNSYQTLYNYIIYKAESMTDNNINRPLKIFFDNIKNANTEYINITKNNNVEEYLKLFISFNQLFFFNFNIYTPYNTIYYDELLAPSLDMIIKFIKLNDMNNIQKKVYDNYNMNGYTYFNLISHHLFITPYINDNPVFNNLNIKYIESMINVIEKNINGIWLDYNNVNNFNLKKINPHTFINLCNMMIKFYQDNYIDRFFIDNNKLIN